MFDQPDGWRAAKPNERALLMHLLRGDFQGKAEILQQMASLQVMSIDQKGSLKLSTDGPLADVKDNDAPSPRANDFIPVEGFYDDGTSDGWSPIRMARLVRLALHVTNGRISELEIYKEDGSPFIMDPYEVDLKKVHFY